jgi:acetylglutamate kinase/N-acetylglutamate synthase-like GNAT family acetyltransferase
MSMERDSSAGQYYRAFSGRRFVLGVSDTASDAVEWGPKVLAQVQELHRHHIHCAVVYGGGKALSEILAEQKQTEAGHRVIQAAAARRIAELNATVASQLETACRELSLPVRILDHSAVTADRVTGAGYAGRVRYVDGAALRRTHDSHAVPIVGFGAAQSGEVNGQSPLYVPPEDVALQVATDLGADKLLFLSEHDGVRNTKGRKVSFADPQALLRLLQQRDAEGGPVIPAGLAPQVEAAIRGVERGIGQAHIVRVSDVLAEILTRTGAGTLVEREQSHVATLANDDEADAVLALHEECINEKFATPAGTTFLRPLSRDMVAALLGSTLVLRHRGVIVGKMHWQTTKSQPETAVLGGFAVPEQHQDSQHGRMIVEETLARVWAEGYKRAVAVTSSDKVAALFLQYGRPARTGECDAQLEISRERYAPKEHELVRAFVFEPEQQ